MRQDYSLANPVLRSDKVICQPRRCEPGLKCKKSLLFAATCIQSLAAGYLLSGFAKDRSSDRAIMDDQLEAYNCVRKAEIARSAPAFGAGRL